MYNASATNTFVVLLVKCKASEMVRSFAVAASKINNEIFSHGHLPFIPTAEMNHINYQLINNK